MRIYLNNEWNYADRFEEAMCSENYDTAKLETVRLPHSVTQTPYDYFSEEIYQKVSGYRRHLVWNPAWEGKRLVLTFEGAAHQACVYLNGELVKQHHCGYTAFSIDITEKLKKGEKADNILTVKLDSRESLNQPPFGFVIDYMTFGGLYREVYLEIHDPVYMKDVFVKTMVAKPGKQVISSEVTLGGRTPALDCVLQQRLLDAETREVLDLWEMQLTDRKQQIGTMQGADSIQLTVTREYTSLILWDTEHPKLYILETRLGESGEVHEVRFGVRICHFAADGFYLNGIKTKLRGVNRHQSYPYVGYAMPKAPQQYDAELIRQELGCNAVRTSHYPQSQHFINRCDEIGLLVFTEIPGWQHIGDESWKQQAIVNTQDMVLQYRNHPSIILWGVRINESQDDDDFYRRTNEVAHALDDTRQTGGVRAHKKSSLLEDVYTYNDFVHAGDNQGCEPKNKVTSDRNKGYLVSEYNGHMYPAKAFDGEEHRVEHAIRHANVLDAVAGQTDIAGSFAWCMFDYNTHKDFGSGDRICYHGLMDQFRNPKLAAAVYAAEAECSEQAGYQADAEHPVRTEMQSGKSDVVLQLSSGMDIGEHPGCNRGDTYIFTNADSVRMYKNDIFIKEYTGTDSPYRNLKHGPILINDFIGDQIEKNEHFTKKQASAVKKALNTTARMGLNGLPLSIKLIAVKLVLFYHMKVTEAVTLYNKYVGDWGGSSTVYRFDAVRGGRIVGSIVKKPMTKRVLIAEADHTELSEGNSYDVASVRIRAVDENGNELSYLNEPVALTLEGQSVAELIGPAVTALRGGMGGTYIKTTGMHGTAVLKLHLEGAEEVQISFFSH